jgi:hypothetical protein
MISSQQSTFAKEYKIGDIVDSVDIVIQEEKESQEILSLKKDPDKLLGKIKKGAYHYAKFPLGFRSPVYIETKEGEKEITIEGSQSLFGGRDYFTIILKESKNSKKDTVLTINKNDEGVILRNNQTVRAVIKSKYDDKGFYMILPENSMESVGFFQESPPIPAN